MNSLVVIICKPRASRRRKLIGIFTPKIGFSDFEFYIVCHMAQNPSAQKSLVVSRMFGQPIEDIEQLKEAIATYAARAGEKLREQKLVAGAMSIFVTTSRFIKNKYFNSHTVQRQLKVEQLSMQVKGYHQGGSCMQEPA